jgi:hypothetical protein
MDLPRLLIMSEDRDEFENDPIDDELEEAMMVAAELVSRAKRLGMPKLELPIRDEVTTWRVTVSKMETVPYPGVPREQRDHDGHNGGGHDGHVK